MTQNEIEAKLRSLGGLVRENGISADNICELVTTMLCQRRIVEGVGGSYERPDERTTSRLCLYAMYIRLASRNIIGESALEPATY
jgi:hypothetical protein